MPTVSASVPVTDSMFHQAYRNSIRYTLYRYSLRLFQQLWFYRSNSPYEQLRLPIFRNEYHRNCIYKLRLLYCIKNTFLTVLPTAYPVIRQSAIRETRNIIINF